MINIYDYLDAIDFINDKFNERKEANKNLSLRGWAKQMGMKSHGPLHAILKKQRNIPKKIIPDLIKTLKLKKNESIYFEHLVDYQRAKTPSEKEFYKEKLEKLSPTPLREISDYEAYKYVTDPVHIMIAEMTQLKGFKDTPAWIKQHLRFNQNIRDIEQMLERLKKLGVIKKEKNKIIKPVEHIYTTYEIQSDVIQDYHKFCSKLAIDQISKQQVEDKEFNTLSLNLKKKDLPKMKEDIREFINKLVKEYEAKPHEGDETYQLNMQLFSLTK